MLSKKQTKKALNILFAGGAVVVDIQPKIGNIKDFDALGTNQMLVGDVSVKLKGTATQGTVKLSAQGDNEPTEAIVTSTQSFPLGYQIFETFEVTDAIALFNGYLVTYQILQAGN